VALLLAAGVGCSTSGSEATGAWVRGYLDPPERVWQAIHLTLDDLGYEVEAEDRQEGTVRAVAVDEGPYRGVVLKIDQIVRTEIVRVHLHVGGGDKAPHDLNAFKAAATEFLANLDLKLDAQR
jgi:hypothetical protein